MSRRQLKHLQNWWRKDLEKSKEEKRFKGIPISPGIFIGKAAPFIGEKFAISTRKISKDQVDLQIKLFKDAIEKTRGTLVKMREELDDRLRSILEPQIRIIDDSSFIEKVIKTIRDERHYAEYAVKKTIEDYAIRMEYHARDDYIKERAKELRQIADLIIKNMRESSPVKIELKDDDILVAYDLSVADTIRLLKMGVNAIVLEDGGKTSHTAIIVKDFRIPAVFGVKGILKEAEDETPMIVDGTRGIVFLNPSEATVEYYLRIQEEFRSFTAGLLKIRDEMSITRDGRAVSLFVNIDFPEEVRSLEVSGKCGIGLFRTEILFEQYRNDEDKQFETYLNVAKEVYPHPVIIRVFDVGADKFGLDELNNMVEQNPFLGVRGIRVLLKYPEIFKIQLRAILRAHKEVGNIKIMIPMVSLVEEVEEAHEILNEVVAELVNTYGENFPVPNFGIMVETPSSAILADKFAGFVDFFSIGTNDLTQYTLAVDRKNTNVSEIYNHLHPSILRLIKQVVEIGHENNILVEVCGELASDPYGVPILLGLGVDGLSVTPSSLLETKELIRRLSFEEIKPIVKDVLASSTADEVRYIVGELIKEKFPDIFRFVISPYRFFNGGEHD